MSRPNQSRPCATATSIPGNMEAEGRLASRGLDLALLMESIMEFLGLSVDSFLFEFYIAEKKKRSCHIPKEI